MTATDEIQIDFSPAALQSVASDVAMNMDTMTKEGKKDPASYDDVSISVDRNGSAVENVDAITKDDGMHRSEKMDAEKKPPPSYGYGFKKVNQVKVK
jgi:hypothetical protein